MEKRSYGKSQYTLNLLAYGCQQQQPAGRVSASLSYTMSCITARHPLFTGSWPIEKKSLIGPKTNMSPSTYCCSIFILASQFHIAVPFSYWCLTFIATSKFNFKMTNLVSSTV
ncbi:hypothetical protein BD408DRAFT_444291, partial [Parasitella parasitica]